MQNGIRAVGSHSGPTTIRRSTLTSIRVGLVLWTGLFLQSCSHLSHSPSESGEAIALKSLNRMCFSSEGKGRVEAFQGRHLFRYESLQDLKKGVWTLALNIPVHGEELIKVRWNEALKGRAYASGSFYRRLVHEARAIKGGEALRNLRGFINKWSLLMELSRQAKQKDISFTCSAPIVEGEWTRSSCILQNKITFDVAESKGKTELSFPLRNTIFKVSSFSLSENFYSRQQYSIERQNKTAAMKLDLFITSCHQ